MEKNVLHILGSLNIGGAENLVLDALNKEAMFLVYMHNSNPQRVELFQQSRVKEVKLIKCGKGIKSTLNFIMQLRKYIKQNNINEIICHNNVDAYWAKIACAGTRVNSIILTIHGFNLDFNFLKNKLKMPFVIPDRLLMKNIAVRYVSSTTRDIYKNKYGWRELSGDIFYNTINENKFKEIIKADNKTLSMLLNAIPIDNDAIATVTKNFYRVGDYQILNDKLLFGMVGNFNTPVRMQMMLCQAILLVKKKIGILPFRFVFAGAKNDTHPYLYDDCVTFCKENKLDNDILFLGQINNVPYLMARLDYYIYASSADAFGLTILEASAAEVPILCSNIPTFREITEDGKIAKLIENTPQDFADEIIKIISC